jgi:hypothetical protein
MLTLPGATPVTRPLADTVASALFDDVHVAVLVTSCVVPSDSVATAENWDVPPIAGAAPVTAIDATVDGAVEDPPHAKASTTSGPETAIEIRRRICMAFSSNVVKHETCSCRDVWHYQVRLTGCGRIAAA